MSDGLPAGESIEHGRGISAGFIKDFLRYVPSRVAPALFSFAVLPLMTRMFRPEEYGEYSLLVNTVSLFSIIAVDWIAMAVTRLYPESLKRGELDLFKATVIKVALVSMMVAVAISIIMTFSTNGFSVAFPRHLVDVGLLMLISGSLVAILMQMFVPQQKPTAYSVFTVISKCACLGIGLLWAWLAGSAMRGFLWGQLAATALTLPFLYVVAMGSFRMRGFSRDLAGEIVKYGLPIAGVNIASWVLSVSDRYVIEAFRGAHEVGLYSVSYNLANGSISALIALLTLSSAPIIMNTWERDGAQEARRALTEFTRYYLIVALPASVAFALLAEPLFRGIVGAEYFEGFRIVPYVCGAMFIYGLQRTFQLGMLFHKRSDLVMYAIMASGVANVVLNVLLIPRYGYVVAGVTTLASYLMYGTAIVVISRSFFRWAFPFVSLLKVLCATCAMAAVIAILMRVAGLNPLLMVGVAALLGVPTYFLLLFAMKEIGAGFFRARRQVR